MKEQDIRAMLEDYIEWDMSRYDMEEIRSAMDEPSPRFRRRMRRLLRNEKYFGTNFRTGYALGKVAAIVLVIGSLAVVGDVSARALGIKPWKYIRTQQLEDVKMESRVYSGNSTVTNEEAKEQNTLPTYVPEGFEQTYTDISNADSVYAEWDKGEEHIQYSGEKIVSGMLVIDDAVYDEIAYIEIHGYQAKLCKKESRIMWVSWDDEFMTHLIEFTNYCGTRDDIIRMAESIYDID